MHIGYRTVPRRISKRSSLVISVCSVYSVVNFLGFFSKH